jgi:hypothetical protein
MSNDKGFDFVSPNFINLYDDNTNRPLKIGDECYFLFTNINDTHLLLIGKGVVVDDFIVYGVHKQYKIEMTNVMESIATQQKFMYGKQFYLIGNLDGKFGNEKLTYIQGNSSSEFFKKNLFKIDCFFIRNTLESVKILRTEYDKIVISDLQNQLNDLNNERV